MLHMHTLPMIIVDERINTVARVPVMDIAKWASVKALRVVMGVRGLLFLTVGFRGPSVPLLQRYSYLHFCACVMLPI